MARDPLQEQNIPAQGGVDCKESIILSVRHCPLPSTACPRSGHRSPLRTPASVLSPDDPLPERRLTGTRSLGRPLFDIPQVRRILDVISILPVRWERWRVGLQEVNRKPTAAIARPAHD